MRVRARGHQPARRRGVHALALVTCMAALALPAFSWTVYISATPSTSFTSSSSVSQSWTPSASRSASDTPTSTKSSSESPSNTRSTSETRTATRSATDSLSISCTASETRSSSRSSSESRSITWSPSESRTATDTPTETRTTTDTPTESSSMTETTSETKSITSTWTVTRSRTPSSTSSESYSNSRSSTASATDSQSESASVSGTRSVTASGTLSISWSATVTSTASVSRSASPSQSNSVTVTSTGTPSGSSTASITASATLTPSITPSQTGTSSTTASYTLSISETTTQTASPSGTGTLPATLSATVTSSETPSQTGTPNNNLRCSLACADGTCSVWGGGPGTCLGSCAAGYAVAPGGGCQVEEVLSFNIVLHAATIDCTTVSSWNTTLVDLGSLTARLGALFSVDPAHMSLRAMGCASDAGTVGGNTRRLSGAVITVGFKLSYLTSAAADAVQSALATVVAYIPTVVVKGVVMSLTSAKAVAVTNACASSCLSCQDLTATACTRCATGYELEGPSPARCVVASVANGITSASSGTLSVTVTIVVVAVSAAVGFVLVVIVLVVYARRRRSNRPFGPSGTAPRLAVEELELFPGAPDLSGESLRNSVPSRKRQAGGGSVSAVTPGGAHQLGIFDSFVHVAPSVPMGAPPRGDDSSRRRRRSSSKKTGSRCMPGSTTHTAARWYDTGTDTGSDTRVRQRVRRVRREPVARDLGVPDVEEKSSERESEVVPRPSSPQSGTRPSSPAASLRWMRDGGTPGPVLRVLDTLDSTRVLVSNALDPGAASVAEDASSLFDEVPLPSLALPSPALGGSGSRSHRRSRRYRTNSALAQSLVDVRAQSPTHNTSSPPLHFQ